LSEWIEPGERAIISMGNTAINLPVDHLHAGFVAMEYFALILNRSFLIFMTDEGLRGWKFSGSVTAQIPTFYRPFEELLDDPEIAPGSSGV